MWPERLVHVGDERDHLLCPCPRHFDHEFGKETASSSFFINAPEPVFTSSTSASVPSASFLLMMRRR